MKTTLTLKKRDFLFNNGLVNLYFLLKGLNTKERGDALFFDNSSIKFYPYQVRIITESLDKLYEKLAVSFFTSLISLAKKEQKKYFDRRNQRFVQAPGFDIKNAPPNDKKNAYTKINIAELGLDRDELFKIAKRDFPGINRSEFIKQFLTDGGRKVYPLVKIEDTAQKYLEYIMRSGKRGFCPFCQREDVELVELTSKVHPFATNETGQFSDLLTRENYICKWGALIYQLGSRTKNYWDLSTHSYFYINSPSLIDLISIKSDLNIKDQRTEITKRKGGNEETKEIPTNIDLGYLGELNFATYHQSDLLLKLILLFYQKVISRRESKKYKKLFSRAEIYSYVQDGKLKRDFIIYTQIYRVFKFFDILREKRILRKLFSRNRGEGILGHISNLRTGQERELHLLSKEIADDILNFRNLQRVYFKVQYQNIKNNNDSPYSLPKSLFEFESTYLEFIKESAEMKEIHKLARTVGSEIGRFLASVDEKDLIFSLRSVYNKEQLVKFFADFSFKYLKEQDSEAFRGRFKGFKKEFRENALEELIDLINESNWEILRDYLAIYMIQKYSATKFAKGGKNG